MGWRMLSRVTTPAGARAALVLGLLSFLIPVLGPVAVLLGARALIQIGAWSESVPGRTTAVLGLAAGLLSSLLLALGVVYFALAALEASLG
jgi:hypothetical protein